jgi:Domain of unknown function (DUF4336)
MLKGECWSVFGFRRFSGRLVDDDLECIGFGLVVVMLQERSQWDWKFWWTLPIYPFGQRRTIRREVVPGEVWVLEQLQGLFYVVTPIRMTVVRLEGGGLLVYAPIAPTRECIELMNELVNAYGDVKYIILPTVSGLEHKVFVGPFARKFKNAQVYVSPSQWSYPVQLPLSWLGLPIGRSKFLPKESDKTPFSAEFDYAILGPISLGVGPFEEVVFFHRRSRTLLVTDSVLSVPSLPPEILQLDPTALLYHAKDSAGEQVEDTPKMRVKGWKRIALFSFYFRPSALEILDLGPAWAEARAAGAQAAKAYFGLYPFRWKLGWEDSFEALSGSGRLFVAPILQQLILNRDPQQVLAWADRVMQWQFERIVGCHLAAPIAAGPKAFREAFSFLERDSKFAIEPLPDADFALLREIESVLLEKGITPPSCDRV